MSNQENTQSTKIAWKNALALLLTILAAIALTASATTNTAADPKLSWIFKTQENAKKSTGVSIAIVSPRWETGMTMERVRKMPEYLQFHTALTSSITELAIAKGMTTKGPFEDIELMTYSEKKGSYLALSPKIAMTSRLMPVPDNSNKVTCMMGGTIILRIVEPFTKENLWRKRLELEKTAFIANRGKEVINRRAVALNSYYHLIMQKLDKYLSPQEMVMLKKQAKELRRRKRF